MEKNYIASGDQYQNSEAHRNSNSGSSLSPSASPQPISPIHSNDHEDGGEIKPTQSRASRFIHEQVNLFHESLRQVHLAVIIKSGFVLLYMSALIMGILSVFWASMYNRSSRTHNLNVWVIDYDQSTIGQSLVDITSQLGQIPSQLGYQIVTPEEYGKSPDALLYDVHQEVAWGALVIMPNATAELQAAASAAIGGGSGFSPRNTVQFIYSEGRQNTVINGQVLGLVSSLNNTWRARFESTWTENLTSSLSDSDLGSLLTSDPAVMLNPVSITLTNVAPIGTDDISTAILTTGLIFLIIVSFFQVANFAQVNMIMLGKVPFIQYMLYRPFVNMVSIFMLSLAFSLISLAFQQDFSAHFGRKGFVIYWMINFMSMWALGGASENIVSVIMNYYPPALGFWLIFWVVLNAATGMSPLELSPGVFKIGRALPVYNAQMAIRTVIFGTRNRLGMNFGILTAWIVINWLMSFPSMATIKWLKGREAAKAAAKAAAQGKA